MTISEGIYFKKFSKLATSPKKCKSGYILYCVEDYVLKPYKKYLMPTGLAFEIPKQYYGHLHPVPEHIGTIKHFAGVIDSDYRGLCNGIVYNDSDNDFIFKIGDPLCMIVFTSINNEMTVECYDGT